MIVMATRTPSTLIPPGTTPDGSKDKGPRESGVELVAEIVRCSCGRGYDHEGWCLLVHRVVSVEVGGRFDLRHCFCGKSLRRPLPEDESVCNICFRWSGPRKMISWAGAVCESCGLKARLGS